MRDSPAPVSPSEHRAGGDSLLRIAAAWRPLLEAASEGICVLNVSLQAVAANPRLSEMLSLGESLPGSFLEWVHQSDRHRFTELCNHHGKPIVRECPCTLVRADGSFVPVEARAQSLCSDSGAFLGCVVTFTDLSSEVALRASLATSEHRLSMALLAGNLGHFDCNLETGVVRWSDEVCAMFGAQASQLRGTLQDLFERVTPLDRQRVVAAAAFEDRSIRFFDEEFRIDSDDGSSRWLHARAQIVRDGAGIPARVVGVIRNTTE